MLIEKGKEKRSVFLQQTLDKITRINLSLFNITECIWKRSCKENSENQDITIFGVLLIVILLAFFYYYNLNASLHLHISQNNVTHAPYNPCR